MLERLRPRGDPALLKRSLSDAASDRDCDLLWITATVCMIRAAVILLAWVVLTLALLPLQLLAVALRSDMQRTIPTFYHRLLCRLIGVRIREVGERAADTPLLILANHVSWLDICVVSAIAPTAFVAKSEVARWPLIGWLARLQNTIFVDRTQPRHAGLQSQSIATRLCDGDAVLLFAEGTSGDGLRVLPFRSALLGAVQHALTQSTHNAAIAVQPLSIAYVGIGGLPIARAMRDRVAWYGDAGLASHLLGVLASGAIDVTVSWGEPRACKADLDRKAVAREAEATVRRMTVAALRGGSPSPERMPPPRAVADIA